MVRMHLPQVRLTTALLSLLAAACALLFAAAPASAAGPTECPLAGSNFQGADGEQNSETPQNVPVACPGGGPFGSSPFLRDWQDVVSSVTTSADATGPDSEFSTGAHEGNPDGWQFDTEAAGGVSPGKANILTAFSRPESL